MNIYIIIIGIIVALLLVIGAVQREKIKTWIRSETKEIIDNNTNHVRVAKLRISDYNKKVINIAEDASVIYAEEEKQKKNLEKMRESSVELLAKAKKAKEDKKPIKAKEYLKLKNETDAQIKIVGENIELLSKKREILELNIQKVKTFISKSEIQLSGLSARKATNSIIRDLKVSTLDGDTLEETLVTAEDSIATEELKLDYLVSDVNVEEEYTADVEKEFDEL